MLAKHRDILDMLLLLGRTDAEVDQTNSKETRNLAHRDLKSGLDGLGQNFTFLGGLELGRNVPLFVNSFGQKGYLGDPFLQGKIYEYWTLDKSGIY